MTRLFWRLYGALLCVLVLVLVLGALAGRPTSGSAGQPHETFIARATMLVQASLHEADEAVLEQAMKEVSAELGTSVDVQTLSALGPTGAQDNEALRNHVPVVLPGPGPGLRLVVPRHTDSRVTVVSIPPEPWRLGPLLASTLALLLMAAVVYLTLRPLQADLLKLEAGARRLGAGDLDVVVPVSPGTPLAPLSQQFNITAERLKTLARGREDLLRAVSHELRTPISRVGFAVDILAGTQDAAEREARAEAIQGDIEELEAIIAELLTYTTLAEDQVPQELEVLDPGPLIAKCVEDGRTVSPDRKIVLSTIQLAPLEADRRLFKRALSNLISNAARYSDSRVEVRSEAHTDWLHIHVDDDGPGVPEPDRERIFAPMVRLDAARSRDTGGIGLGLALARRIAIAHGGRLVCQGSPLGGARFTLSWPSRPMRRDEPSE